MLILASHVLGFLSLLIGAIYDLKTTEVPDLVSVIGVVGGIGLHAAYAYLISSPNPIVWSLGVGAIFSLYGWGMYYMGMWGGADAFAMSVLGFAAPYGLADQSIVYSVNMFINIMLVGFLYTMAFASYKAIRSGDVMAETVDNILENEKRISLEIVAASILAAASDIYLSVNGVLYFAVFLSLIFLYRFLSVLEDSEMSETVSVSELDPGDVIAQEDVEIERVRQKNFVGMILDRARSLTGENRLDGYISDLQTNYGYSQIVGITEGEIKKLQGSETEKVKVKTGVRFVPVFPIALAITDIFGGGLHLLTLFIS